MKNFSRERPLSRPEKKTKINNGRGFLSQEKVGPLARTLIVLAICLTIFLPTAFSHSSTNYAWNSVNPTLLSQDDIWCVGECIDEDLYRASNCEFKTRHSSFSAKYVWSNFLGDERNVTEVTAKCTGNGCGRCQYARAWNYDTGSWNRLGTCGDDGTRSWDLGPQYFDNEAQEMKLKATSPAPNCAACRIVELWTNDIDYEYNTYPTGSPNLNPVRPYANETLSLNKNYADSDGDSEENSSITWFVNGEQVTNNTTALDETKFQARDTVTVEYVPCDSYGGCGSTYTSQVSVKNYVPSVNKSTYKEKLKGGTNSTWFVEAKDIDKNQTVVLECAVDDGNITSNECKGTVEQEANDQMNFSCKIEVPYDTANHTLDCKLADGMNETRFEDDFETDVTPPDGTVSVRDKNRFISKRKPVLDLTADSDTSKVKLACEAAKISGSNWADYNSTYKGFNVSAGPGCPTGIGNRTVCVKYQDDVGNVQQGTSCSGKVFLDSPPNITYLSVKPSPPTKRTDLECEARAKDEDSSEINTTYQWFLNGTRNSTGSVLSKEHFEKGDLVRCMAEASDGYRETSKNSSGLEVKNAPPDVGVSIKENSDNLTCSYCFSDADEDEVSLLSQVWLLNGTYLTENISVDKSGSYSDTYTCLVNATDSQNASAGNATYSMPSVCGNSFIEGSEECDSSNLGNETCETQGFDQGTLACASSCTFNTSGCSSSSVCGNGFIEGSEECDSSNLGNETCETQGFDQGTLACASSCTFNTSGCSNDQDSEEGDTGSSGGSSGGGSSSGSSSGGGGSPSTDCFEGITLYYTGKELDLDTIKNQIYEDEVEANANETSKVRDYTRIFRTVKYPQGRYGRVTGTTYVLELYFNHNTSKVIVTETLPDLMKENTDEISVDHTPGVQVMLDESSGKYLIKIKGVKEGEEYSINFTTADQKLRYELIDDLKAMKKPWTYAQAKEQEKDEEEVQQKKKEEESEKQENEEERHSEEKKIKEEEGTNQTSQDKQPELSSQEKEKEKASVTGMVVSSGSSAFMFLVLVFMSVLLLKNQLNRSGLRGVEGE